MFLWILRWENSVLATTLFGPAVKSISPILDVGECRLYFLAELPNILPFSCHGIKISKNDLCVVQRTFFLNLVEELREPFFWSIISFLYGRADWCSKDDAFHRLELKGHALENNTEQKEVMIWGSLECFIIVDIRCFNHNNLLVVGMRVAWAGSHGH